MSPSRLACPVLLTLTFVAGCGDDSGGGEADDAAGDTDAASSGVDGATTAPVNVSPQASDDEFFARQGEALTVVGADGLFANDVDDDPLALDGLAVVSDAGVTVTTTPDGGLTYAAPPDFFGVDRFEYTIVDPFGETATAEVVVHVAPAAVSLGALQTGAGGVTMPGPIDAALAGNGVAGIGDVNGDGLDDVLIGAPFLELSPGFERVAENYVVFGREDGIVGDLSSLGDGGFVVRGAEPGDRAGFSVDGAGDVNGDGLDDFIVGAPGGFYERAYVVFGRPGNGDIDLGALGGAGFVIEEASELDGTGTHVAGAGDVNGDGLDDLIVAAPLTYEFGDPGQGRVYVVFGKNDSNPVQLQDMYDLSLTSPAGFAIAGVPDFEVLGADVAGAGDVNGDGLDDIIIGAPSADPGGMTDAGRAYVVFGKADANAVMLSALGAGGFTVDGDAPGAFTGISVGRVGDLDADGLDDVLVGATTQSSELGIPGRAFVVFGKADDAPVSVALLGDEGITIGGGQPGDFAGASLDAAGDVNGDGIDDIVVGAAAADVDGMSGAGRTYVVYGAADLASVKLATLGEGGFSLAGEAIGDGAARVAGAGDVNGDGLADVIVGAPWHDTAAGTDAGQTYLVYGVRTAP